jgi:hypothetical protein
MWTRTRRLKRGIIEETYAVYPGLYPGMKPILKFMMRSAAQSLADMPLRVK